jgi:hypothetical protein
MTMDRHARDGRAGATGRAGGAHEMGGTSASVLMADAGRAGQAARRGHRGATARRWGLALAVVALAGCALPGLTPLAPGLTEAEVQQRWGPPTGRYVLPDGQRLEYARGPAGQETWMVDLDAQGRTVAWRQVLEYQALQQLQGSLPGMTTAEVLPLIGRPSAVRSGGRQGGQVWSWRHDSPFCLWLQASVGDDGRLRDAGFYPDPACDPRDDHAD